MRQRQRASASTPIYAPNPVMAGLAAWVADFEAGRVVAVPPADGVLQPGERLAVVAGPVTTAVLDRSPDVSFRQLGPTGTMVATDRRVVLVEADGRMWSWAWATDVDRVSPLGGGWGVFWAPSSARQEAGMRHLECLVTPETAAGARPDLDGERFVAFAKVQAAWRVTQPGGADLWISELRQRYRA